MDFKLYKEIILKSSIGYAYHKILYDENKKPCDYVFLEANSAFEELTGLKANDIIGKKITEILPDILFDDFDWIAFYADIATNNLQKSFTQHSATLNKDYWVNAFSPEKDHFVTLFSFPQASETNFKNLFNNMPSGGVIYKVINKGKSGRDYIGLDFNKQSCILENKNKEMMIGKTSYELRPNLDKYGLIDVFRQVWETGQPQKLDAKKYTDEKFDNYYEIEVFKLSPDSIVAIYDDVTELIRAQKKLKESRDKLQAYIDKAPYGIFITDENGYYVDVNIEGCNITGFSQKEIVGKNLIELVEESHRPRVKKEFAHLKSTGFLDSTMKYVTKKGEVRWWNVRASRLDENHYLGFKVDVTEKMQTEDMLKRFENITNLHFIGYIFADFDRRIIRSNDYFANVHGWDANEVIGKKVDIFHTQEQMPDVLKVFEELKVKSSLKSFELMHCDKNGRIFPMLMSAVTMKNDDGIPQHIASFALDISNYKELEENNIKMQMMLQNQQKLESIGTLASGVAHEINNPINGIMNYSQLISDTTSPDSENHIFANEIINETKRIAGIVNSLLKFSRQGKSSYSKAFISDIIDSCRMLIETLVKHESINFTIDIQKDLPPIKCRNQQIQQVILNLITNASDSMKEKHEGHDEEKKLDLSVKLITKKKKKYIQIAVRDNGTGITDEIENQIFDPFFTTKPRDKGTGLGLAISYGIVSEHKGEIYFESKKGKYTIFYVNLPV